MVQCDKSAGGCGKIDFVRIGGVDAIRKVAKNSDVAETLFREVSVMHRLSILPSPFIAQFYCMELSLSDPYESLRVPAFLEERIHGASLEQVDFTRLGMKGSREIFAHLVLAIEGLVSQSTLDLSPSLIYYYPLSMLERSYIWISSLETSCTRASAWC
jgi:hypothetical protein